MNNPRWAEVITTHAVESKTAERLIYELINLEDAALSFCRLLERWARGEAEPPTPLGRTLALRRAAERVAAALATLERPLGRYLLELQPEQVEGRSWFGEPGRAELVDWEPVLSRAGVEVPAHRVTSVYLELAVLIRALEGLAAAVAYGATPPAEALWVGLFDLRDNLLGAAAEELRLLAA